MNRLGHYIRIAAGISLLAVCALTAWSSAKQVYYGILYSSMALHVLLAVATALAWALFCAGGLGLIMNQAWAFWFVYAAAVLNLGPGYVLVPLIGMLVAACLDPLPAMIVSLYGVNLAFIALLVFAHVATRQRPEIRYRPIGLDPRHV